MFAYNQPKCDSEERCAPQPRIDKQLVEVRLGLVERYLHRIEKSIKSVSASILKDKANILLTEQVIWLPAVSAAPSVPFGTIQVDRKCAANDDPRSA